MEYIRRSYLGPSYKVIAALWNLINPTVTIKHNAQPKYLLWALLFLYKYNTEAVNIALVGITDEKWFWDQAWEFVFAIAGLKDEVIIF